MRTRSCICRGLTVCLLGTIAASACAAETAAPAWRTFRISPQRLAQTKVRVQQHDAALQPAMASLRNSAEAALKTGPFSVMQKTVTPPSGDKHDYLSLAPYWWPNPDKPDSLPYIRRDGEVSPQSSAGTDRPAFQKMAAAVETLALAYALTDDDRYAAHAAQLLRVWFLDPATRMNPHLNYGQGIPGINHGRCIGIIDTTRLTTLVDAVGLLAPSDQWTAADQQGLVAWCKAYLHWLHASPFGRQEQNTRNNHGSWCDAQIVALALFVGQNDLAREVLEAAKQRRIAKHIEPDGRQPEELKRTKSFSYSLFNLRALFTLAHYGGHVGVDLWRYQTADGRSLQRALDFLAPYANPKRTWPLPELHMDRGQLLQILREADAAYGTDRYRTLLQTHFAKELTNDRSQLLFGPM